MTTVTMTARDADFLISEAPGTLSRETITLVSGAGNLAAGTVLSPIAAGAATASAISGTGNATCSAVVVSAGVAVGVHRLLAIAATKLQLFDPTGKLLGVVTVGTAATLGGLTLTITAGATPMVAGDFFLITVAAGAGTYKAYDDDNADGSDVAAGVLLHGVDATDAAQTAVMVARLAEVDSAQLIWASTNDAGDKTAGLADLAARFIFARS